VTGIKEGKGKEGVYGYKRLLVWVRAKELVVLTYKITERFPKSETYGLTSQIRRAAVSVCVNIAEGYSRQANSKKDYLNFLNIAKGSLVELEALLDICSEILPNIVLLDMLDFRNKIKEVGFLLYKLILGVKNSIS